MISYVTRIIWISLVDICFTLRLSWKQTFSCIFWRSWWAGSKTSQFIHVWRHVWTRRKATLTCLTCHYLFTYLRRIDPYLKIQNLFSLFTWHEIPAQCLNYTVVRLFCHLEQVPQWGSPKIGLTKVFVYMQITLVSFSKKMLRFPVDILGNCHMTLTAIACPSMRKTKHDYLPSCAVTSNRLLLKCLTRGLGIGSLNIGVLKNTDKSVLKYG